MMIDWFTGKVPFYYEGILSDGEVMSIDACGAVEYSTPKRKVISGSYATNFTIRTTNVDSDGNTCEVQLSGNPVKFLQGHNIWGSDDLPNLVYETVLKISAILGIEQPLHILSKLKQGMGTVSRVDINEMYKLGSRSNVLAYLFHASQNSRTRAQSAVSKGSTVYLNKESRRWSVKLYSKGQEVELPRNNKQGLIELSPSVKKFCDDALRIELTLKQSELNDIDLKNLVAWHNVEIDKLFNKYYERLVMADQLELQLIDLNKLSLGVRSTYQLWFTGHDVRNMVSKPTFYRHRKQLLEHGIDISMPANTTQPDRSNVVPLVRTITLTPATIPEWAKGTQLFFEPRKHIV